MSVLVRGMEIPESCHDCPFIDEQRKCSAKPGWFVRLDKLIRQPWCPLIYVPSHGDLIERDAAYDKIAEQEGGNYVDMDAVGMGLNETPVIIPEDDAWPEWRTQVLGIRRQEEGIRPGQIWRHFKGGIYRVLYLAKQSETKEEYVIYTSEDGGGAVWARPASMWLETVERDGKSQPRFELIFDPPRNLGFV